MVLPTTYAMGRIFSVLLDEPSCDFDDYRYDSYRCHYGHKPFDKLLFVIVLPVAVLFVFHVRVSFRLDFSAALTDKQYYTRLYNIVKGKRQRVLKVKNTA